MPYMSTYYYYCIQLFGQLSYKIYYNEAVRIANIAISCSFDSILFADFLQQNTYKVTFYTLQYNIDVSTNFRQFLKGPLVKPSNRNIARR